MLRTRFAALFASLSLFALLVAGCGDSDDDGDADLSQWPAFFSLPELLEASDVVVVAELVAEQTIEVTVEPEEGTDPQDRHVITEILRTYVLVDSLKGDLAPEDVINVVSTANIARYPEDGSEPSEVVYQVLKAEEDTPYVLFLTLAEVPEDYPETFGRYVWAAPAEPHTARVGEGGVLQWETTGRYDAVREDRGIEAGEQGAGPGFDVTIEVVRTLAQGLPEETPEGNAEGTPTGEAENGEGAATATPSAQGD
jgi:hypothetical protein